MSRFASVSLFSLVHDDEEAAHAAGMPFAHRVATARVTRVWNLLKGAARIPTTMPLTHSLLDAPRAERELANLAAETRADVVVAYCSGMARFAMRPPLEGLPYVLDMVDVDSLKWAQMSARAGPVHRWLYGREARTLRAFEATAVRRAAATLVVNAREREVLQHIEGAARVHVIENGIDTAAFAPPAESMAAPLVVFCGVMDYFPNEEGVRWFGEHVWPHVRNRRPDARFLVVGARPTRAIEELARRDPSIEATGSVPAVQPYLWRSAVSVAPLFLARGLQNKVLEALAAGLPVVATPAVIQGLPLEARNGCVSADSPGTFAEAVVRLLEASSDYRKNVASTADVQALAWSRRLGALEQILKEAAGTRRVA